MQPKMLASVIGVWSVAALMMAVVPVSAQEPAPHAMPMDGSVIVHDSDGGCSPCNKCRSSDPCKKCFKKTCKPSCPPLVSYKGCPAPCAVDRVVTVSRRCGCSVDVAIKVPAGCEKVKRERDGDVRYEVGRYCVHIDWEDGGKKLKVRYHS